MACIYLRHVSLAQAHDPVAALRSIGTAIATFKLHMPIRMDGIALHLRAPAASPSSVKRSQHAHLLRLAMSLAPTVDLVVHNIAVVDQVR